jgi:glycosyltransferase involved in cell wall biosynthesis
MSAPLVTICLPTIGRFEMLAETLASLSQQTYPHLEILILDNACASESRQELDRFAAADPRAHILRSDERLPMFENFNRGIRAASGDYVAFFFDDDIYLPDFVERQLRMLQAHPEAGFVGSNYFLIDEHSQVIGLRRLVKKTGVVAGRDYIERLIWRGRNVIGTPGIMFRRDLLAASPFDASLSVHFGDFVVLMRLAELADVALISQPLIKMRTHSSAASASVPPSEAIPLRTNLLRDYIAEYAARWPDDPKYVDSLRRGLERSHVVGLLAGWIMADSNVEATACLAGLCLLPVGKRLATALRLLDRLGVSTQRRHGFLSPLLARIGRAIPV